MSKDKVLYNDEISLFEIWDKLKIGWRYVIGGMLFGVNSVFLQMLGDGQGWRGLFRPLPNR